MFPFSLTKTVTSTSEELLSIVLLNMSARVKVLKVRKVSKAKGFKVRKGLQAHKDRKALPVAKELKVLQETKVFKVLQARRVFKELPVAREIKASRA